MSFSFKTIPTHHYNTASLAKKLLRLPGFVVVGYCCLLQVVKEPVPELALQLPKVPVETRPLP